MKRLIRSTLETTSPKLLYSYDIFRARHSEPEIRLLSRLCRHDRISIDVGANKGLYCRHMIPHSSTVIAFEPLPEMVKRLKTVFADRICIHEVALSNQPGEVTLRLPSGNPALATIEDNNRLGSQIPETRAVPTRRLDDYKINNIGLIKIDVEGHEAAVLEGSIETIRREKPNLIIEIEERHNKGSVVKVSALLKEWGYGGYFLENGQMTEIERFYLERDQNIKNVSLRGKIGRYINNFIFLP